MLALLLLPAALAACELNDQEMEGYKAVMTLIEKGMIDAGQAGSLSVTWTWYVDNGDGTTSSCTDSSPRCCVSRARSKKAWDVQSMANLFDLQGRTSLISCCQFDASRLIADGTHHILVTHDFSDSPNQEDNGQNNTFTYDGSADDGSSEGGAADFFGRYGRPGRSPTEAQGRDAMRDFRDFRNARTAHY